MNQAANPPSTSGADVIERAGSHSRKPATMQTPSLSDFRRVVVKVGSSLIVGASRVNEDWLASLAEDIARLHADKRDVLVVSSGAIALGRAVLQLPKGPLKLEEIGRAHV